MNVESSAKALLSRRLVQAPEHDSWSREWAETMDLFRLGRDCRRRHPAFLQRPENIDQRL